MAVTAGEVDRAAAAAPRTLADILEHRAAHDPDAAFVVDVDGGCRLTYRQAFDRAEQLRAVLAANGVREGDVVGLYLANSAAWIVASFAVWRSGCTVAACGTLLPPEEVRPLFESAGARVVVRAADAPPPGAPAQLAIGPDGELDRPAGAEAAAAVAPDPEDDACIFFTSGTTGQPKGILHTHAQLVEGARGVASAYARSGEFRPRTAPPHLAPGVVFNPFGHAAGYGRLSFRLWIGRPIVLVTKFSVDAVRALTRQYRFESLQLTPAMVYMLAHADQEVRLDGLEYVTSGTAPLPVATRQRFEERYGIPVMQAYGMTETGAVAQERLDDIRAGRRGPGSVGRPARGIEVRIVDEEGRQAAAGHDGEIAVRRTAPGRGYLDSADCPLDADGWFHTGDRGRLSAEGILSVTGRLHDKMIVGGFNVYPGDVEDALRLSPLVRDVVVVPLPDERLGERPVAGVVWAGEPRPDQLLAEARGRLAHYKVPRAFFGLDEVPRTAREKVDRPGAAGLARRALVGGD